MYLRYQLWRGLSRTDLEAPYGRHVFWARYAACSCLSKHLSNVQDVTSWNEFLSAFCDYHKITAKKLEGEGKLLMMKAMLADNEEEKVKIEEWAKILECFGPMNGLRFLDNMAALLSKEYVP